MDKSFNEIFSVKKISKPIPPKIVLPALLDGKYPSASGSFSKLDNPYPPIKKGMNFFSERLYFKKPSIDT